MALTIEAKITRHAKINNDLILRVTRGEVSNPEDHALIITKAPSPSQASDRYAAIIQALTDDVVIKHPITIKLSSRKILDLADGDIIRVPAQGNFIDVVFRVNSSNNALFVTNRCNSKCILCPQKPMENDPPDNVRMIMKQIDLTDKSVKWLGITGGEPTVLKEDLVRIIAKCKDTLPNTNILLLSNGMAFSDFAFCKQIAEVKPRVLIVAITLYSDYPKDHDFITGVKNSFFRTSEGIYKLNHVGIPVEIRIVIHRHNFDRLSKVARYIYMNFPFAFHIAFMGLEITGYAADNLNEVWIEPPRFQEELKMAVNYLRKRNRMVSIYNLPLCMIAPEIRGLARQSISDYKKVYHEICENCIVKSKCSGFFSSCIGLYSPHIKPILKTTCLTF